MKKMLLALFCLLPLTGHCEVVVESFCYELSETKLVVQKLVIANPVAAFQPFTLHVFFGVGGDAGDDDQVAVGLVSR